MPATFLRSTIVNREEGAFSEAAILVDNREFLVSYESKLLSEMEKDDLKEYLCAEALRLNGKAHEALSFLLLKAEGSIIEDENGNILDTRNWRKLWIDTNFIVMENSHELEEDPLL